MRHPTTVHRFTRVITDEGHCLELADLHAVLLRMQESVRSRCNALAQREPEAARVNIMATDITLAAVAAALSALSRQPS